MLRFYPDTNIVHRLRAAWSAAQYDCQSERADLTLALGFHVLYELMRGLVLPTAPTTVFDVCAAGAFLAGIERIEFVPTVDRLFEAELHRAVTGVELVTVVDELGRAATRQELFALAEGNSARAHEFIAEREARVLESHRRAGAIDVAAFRSLERNDELRQRYAQFEAFRTDYRYQAVAMLRQTIARMQRRVPDHVLETIAGSPDRFPVATTWLNCQWYLSWIAATSMAPPAADKRDDFRHLVESATADAFVTAESGLARRAVQLSPHRPTWTWGDLVTRLACRSVGF